jgi:archaellin
MSTLRALIITITLSLSLIIMPGCSSTSSSSGPSKISGKQKSKDPAKKTYFRHRWWNYYQRGMDYAENGEMVKAIADFSSAINQRDGDQRMARTYGMHFIDYFASRELGILFFENGQYKEAEAALERSINSYPSAKAKFYLDQVRKAIIQKSGRIIPPPNLKLSFKNQEVRTREDPIIIEGMAWDDHYVRSVTINENQVYMEGALKNIQFQSKLYLSEGRHNIVVKAINLVGHTTKRTVTITVDRKGPLIVVNRIVPEDTEKDYSYTIHLIISDNSGVSNVHLNNVPKEIKTDREIQFQYSLPLNKKTLRIEAIDRLGNRTVAIFNVEKGRPLASAPILLAMNSRTESIQPLAYLSSVRDKQPPEIEIKDWKDSQTVYFEKIYIDGVISDPNNVVSLTINNKPILNRSAKIVYFNHIEPLEEGDNALLIEATDSKGNRSEKRFTVTRKIPAALDIDARLKVTVIPFVKKGDLSTASYTFQAFMLDAMFHQNRFRLIERNALESILQEQKLSQTELIDEKTALRVGRMAAAQSIIIGDIIESRKGIEIVSRMIDTETSDILALNDVYSELKDRQAMQTLAKGMAIKYHHDFPLVGGIVVSRKGMSIITDMGRQKVKQQRRLLVYKESPIHHPDSGMLLGVDKEILGRAWITAVDEKISKATLLEVPSGEVQEQNKVITE